jgi:hypothetical protein
MKGVSFSALLWKDGSTPKSVLDEWNASHHSRGAVKRTVEPLMAAIIAL